MKRSCFVISLALAAFMCTDCAIFGRGKEFKPFDENSLKEVTAGKTTAAEVTQLFGPPNKIVRLSNGNAYVYERSIQKATGLWLVVLSFGNWDRQYDRMAFFINNEDLVTHIGSSFKAETASYAMPF